jgi:peptidoglycan/LPS O-acetylase OafA/YrhL
VDGAHTQHEGDVDVMALELEAKPVPPAGGTRKRLDHIDAMRPIKQAAVISTHTLIFFAPLATSSAVVGLVMLTRFSRDAFLFVSACMLTFSYRDSKQMLLGNYFKRRFLSVGVPYLAWTVIYFFYTSLTTTKTFTFYSFKRSSLFSSNAFHYFVHLLLTGYYHLYYLLVIMEFYLLFPLLIMFVHRFAKWHVHIMVVAVLWQIAFGVLVSSPHFGFSIPGLIQTRLISSYPVYIIGGMIVALHLEEVHKWICDKARWILFFTLVCALGAEELNYLGRFSWLPHYLHTGTNIYAPAILPFNIGAILCVYLLGVHLVAPGRSPRTRAAVRSGSDNSYGVYLSQMIWIPLLLRLRNASGLHLPWEVAAPLALIIVYFAGFAFTALIARTRLAKSVGGRSRASWKSLVPRRQTTPPAIEVDQGDGPMDLAEA